MGKIGEWREILRSAAERAAFWARLSWEEARENGNRYSEAAGKGESGEKRIEGKNREEIRGKRELWVEKEAETGEREERAEKIYKDDASYDAEERERKRNDMRERFEKEAAMREEYDAEEILRRRYKLAENFEEYAGRASAGVENEGERIFENRDEILKRTAEGAVSAEELFLAERGNYGAAEITADEIVKGIPVEAVRRRLSYGGSVEMKREMLKMKQGEADRGGEVKIEMINNNQFKSEVDMDAITDRLTERIVDLMARSADGIY